MVTTASTASTATARQRRPGLQQRTLAVARSRKAMQRWLAVFVVACTLAMLDCSWLVLRGSHSIRDHGKHNVFIIDPSSLPAVVPDDLQDFSLWYDYWNGKFWVHERIGRKAI